jgi:hypothetical protein
LEKRFSIKKSWKRSA